jgi:hypothetical protein
MHNTRFAALHLVNAMLSHIIGFALRNISYTVNAASQLDNNAAVH